MATQKPTVEQFTTRELSPISGRASSFFDQAGYDRALNEYNQSQVEAMEKESTEKNKVREDEIRGILDQIIGMYQPGGGFGKGMEGQIERGRTQSVASGMQGLVSSGLSNTTQAAGLGKKYEEEVAMPARMKLEDIRYGALSQAMGQKASFVERIEDMLPDYGLVAQLLSKAAGA